MKIHVYVSQILLICLSLSVHSSCGGASSYSSNLCESAAFVISYNSSELMIVRQMNIILHCSASRAKKPVGTIEGSEATVVADGVGGEGESGSIAEGAADSTTNTTTTDASENAAAEAGDSAAVVSAAAGGGGGGGGGEDESNATAAVDGAGGEEGNVSFAAVLDQTAASKVGLR